MTFCFKFYKYFGALHLVSHQIHKDYFAEQKIEKMTERTRAQESRAAIQQLYISMRHLFIRGGYKPLGVSGEAMIEALMNLQPEIYGSLTDPEKIELEGLLYIFQRLPEGIEECRFIRLITKEGFELSGFTPIVS